ncbi:hypothetical protein IAR55_001939 [Kwoniella newhampshirensis]|uniref:Uncharacterized protein n=1 Tax=Kwoniella newhampshirensis TaxID=1651941 RepID=A0AAW0Z3J0_9TREE
MYSSSPVRPQNTTMSPPPYQSLEKPQDGQSPFRNASALLLTTVVRGSLLRLERPWAVYPLITVVLLPNTYSKSTHSDSSPDKTYGTEDGRFSSASFQLTRKGFKLCHLMHRLSTQRYIELWSSHPSFVSLPLTEHRSLLLEAISQIAQELLSGKGRGRGRRDQQYEYAEFLHFHCDSKKDWDRMMRCGRKSPVLREKEHEDVISEVDREVGREMSRNEIAEKILKERRGHS